MRARAARVWCAAVTVLLVGCGRTPVMLADPHPAALPPSVALAVVHARDLREEPDRLGRVWPTGRYVRPYPADLITLAMETALRNRGYLVAGILKRDPLDDDAMKGFLRRHGLRSCLEVEVLSLDAGGRAILGRAWVSAKIRVRVLPSDGPAFDRTFQSRVSRWSTFRVAAPDVYLVSSVTRDAILRVTRDAAADPELRKAMEGGRGVSTPAPGEES